MNHAPTRFLATAALLLVGTLAVQAQLADCWDPANWTINANNTTATNAVGTFLITLENDMDFAGSGLDSIDCAETEGTSTVCIAVPATGDFTFDWSIAGAPFFFNPFIDRFGYCLNGEVTELSSADPPPFGTSAGTHTVALTAGDEFCFVYASKFSDVPTPLTVSISNFITPACADPCDAMSQVTGLSVDSLLPNGTAVKLSWDALAGADAYQIEGGPAGGGTRRSVLTATTITIPSLSPGTTYNWRVRARCAASGLPTAWSASSSFTTPSPRLAASATNVQVWPNPATDWVTVRRTGEHASSPAQLHLYDALGRLVRQQQSSASNLQFGLSGVPAGAYVLEVRTEHGVERHTLQVR